MKIADVVAHHNTNLLHNSHFLLNMYAIHNFPKIVIFYIHYFRILEVVIFHISIGVKVQMYYLLPYICTQNQNLVG